MGARFATKSEVKAEPTEECKTLNIIHFNDVYNINEGNKDICGGAARFMALINKLKSLKPSPIIFLVEISYHHQILVQSQKVTI